MPAPKADRSDSIRVIKLERASDTSAPKRGRPKKLTFPALPQEIYDGMTELEREHFEFFINAHLEQYPDLLPTDYIALYSAGMEYIAYLRMQASQLATGQLVSMARQHPGVQLRAWMDSLSVTRKQRGPASKKDDEAAEFLKALSAN
jgi:hypothetical protein